MTKVRFVSQQKEASLLQFTEHGVLDEIKEILSQFWIPPHEASAHIKDIISSLAGDSSLDIVVAGETKNISLYIVGSTEVLAITPFLNINENILLQEIYGEATLPRNCTWYIFPADTQLLLRLSFPKVLLVNPCVLENFPIPRLCLSIGLLGSYLRKYQKADVRIIDMQVGSTIEDIIKEAAQLQPALVGMSISYGQKHVALSILKEIYRIKKDGLVNPLVVLGNIIPASFPKEFMEVYPDLIVACGEGELANVGLIEYINGQRKLADVPGIAYLDITGKIIFTPNMSVPMETIPLPALDTIEGLKRCRGALTLELSRGCQWNVCTFCPREHKSKTWKTMTPQRTLEQFGYLHQVCEQFDIARHVFLADEEFVGTNNGTETERIEEVANGLITSGFGMKFDAEARVDQVYNPKMDREWHAGRMKMWHLCHQAGLDRLFMGIESGSNTQLKRYGKGIKAEDSVIAIRILSALGIPLRFGFITFDQLMIGLEELKENIGFLERTDAFIGQINVAEYGYEELFDLLISDEEFIAEHSLNKPIYAGISYMLATMEVLIRSPYKTMLDHAEKRYGKSLILDENAPDTNMGRYKVGFVDDLIRDISISCQMWIDKYFGFAYCVKSLYKVAPEREKEHLMAWMIAYRRISFHLLKAIVYIFDKTNKSIDSLLRMQLIQDCMNAFDQLVADKNRDLEALLRSNGITDSIDGQLLGMLKSCQKNTGTWGLINEVLLERP